MLKLPEPMDNFRFQDEIRLEPINLARAALCYAREIGYPALAVDDYLLRLDDLAAGAGDFVDADASTLVRAEQLAGYLFEQVGFQGNSANYSDPRNSFLNEVIDRRLGIPITLSAIFLSVAKRLALPARGVGLPGHFIVSVQGDNGPLFLDPFYRGQQLSIIACARLVELSTGYNGPFQPEWLEPVQPLDILARMLNNLRTIYIQQGKQRMLLPVVERLAWLQPDNPNYLRDFGMIYQQNGSLGKAVEYYQRYLTLAPQAADAGQVRQNLLETAQKLAQRN